MHTSSPAVLMRNSKRSNASAHTTRLHDQDSLNCTTNWTSGWQWLRRFMSSTPTAVDDSNPPPPTPCTASISGINVVMDKESGRKATMIKKDTASLSKSTLFPQTRYELSTLETLCAVLS